MGWLALAQTQDWAEGTAGPAVLREGEGRLCTLLALLGSLCAQVFFQDRRSGRPRSMAWGPSRDRLSHPEARQAPWWRALAPSHPSHPSLLSHLASQPQPLLPPPRPTALPVPFTLITSHGGHHSGPVPRERAGSKGTLRLCSPWLPGHHGHLSHPCLSRWLVPLKLCWGWCWCRAGGGHWQLLTTLWPARGIALLPIPPAARCPSPATATPQHGNTAGPQGCLSLLRERGLQERAQGEPLQHLPRVPAAGPAPVPLGAARAQGDAQHCPGAPPPLLPKAPLMLPEASCCAQSLWPSWQHQDPARTGPL